MSWALVSGAIWVIAATLVALLPMRRQYVPGVMLLVMAPFLIGWLWFEYGWVVGGLALAGFLSMFRNPLRYLLARARGQRPEVPR